MPAKTSPTLGLLAGLAITLSAVAVYSGFTIVQFRTLRRIQTETIDHNRMDSLLLLRIQNNLNSLSLAMRDMLETSEPYALTAWRAQFKRIRVDLEDAMAREDPLSAATPDQRHYLAASMTQFWDALDRTFALAQEGREAEARTQIRNSLQARQEALASAVARLLVRNNEREQEAAGQTRDIYARAERSVYIFLAAMLLLILATSLYLVQHNRRMFEQVATLSERRSELAQQLITIQENTFRHIARELHDEFGQVLTAVGSMLQRANRRAAALETPLREELGEVLEIVQSTLDKVRALSQALHPVVLEDAGFEGALQAYLPGFEKQTGIEVHFHQEGETRPVDRDVAIHLYRVLQEALNNVARHAGSPCAWVRLSYRPAEVVLEIEDSGVGFSVVRDNHGLGLTSMRERAELVNGTIEYLDRAGGGSLVRLTVPLNAEGAHAEA